MKLINKRIKENDQLRDELKTKSRLLNEKTAEVAKQKLQLYRFLFCH